MLSWNFRFDRYGKSFSYRMHRRQGDRLAVFFPGLRSRTSTEVEYYNRLSWSDSFPHSCLFVADPGLSAKNPTVRGTWFQGGKDFFSAEKVAQDIREISAEFGFSEARTVLYGSSQGGFAALSIGAYLTGAVVLAECPQSNVRLFNMKEDTNRAAKVCYGVDNIADVPANFEPRLNVLDLYKTKQFIPRGRILVKDSDEHAVDVHIRPLQQIDTRNRIVVNVFEGELGLGGHAPLPREIIVDAINSMMAS